MFATLRFAVKPRLCAPQVRQQCDHNNLLGAALQLGPQLPSAASLARWAGEPVKALLLPTACFTTNKRGYPVLPKAHQDVLASFFKLGVQVGVSVERVGADGGGAGRLLPGSGAATLQLRMRCLSGISWTYRWCGREGGKGGGTQLAGGRSDPQAQAPRRHEGPASTHYRQASQGCICLGESAR